jgi:hypothetical protein
MSCVERGGCAARMIVGPGYLPKLERIWVVFVRLASASETRRVQRGHATSPRSSPRLTFLLSWHPPFVRRRRRRGLALPPDNACLPPSVSPAQERGRDLDQPCRRRVLLRETQSVRPSDSAARTGCLGESTGCGIGLPVWQKHECSWYNGAAGRRGVPSAYAPAAQIPFRSHCVAAQGPASPTFLAS